MNQLIKMLFAAGALVASNQVEAQQAGAAETKPEKEIIIRKKTDKDTKVTIEINGDDVRVNGKPLAEFDDKNLDIDLELTRPRAITRLRGATSPFRGSTWNFESPEIVTGYGITSNRAVLGVSTTKEDNGAKVLAVTKGSGAEKAGMKEGDVIIGVADAKIESPDDLTKAIAKYKPEEKVEVRFKRDKKEQKVTATLTKPSATSVYSRNFRVEQDMEPGIFYGENGQNRLMIASATPKLGIKAQDTDDGKGVKVLSIDENSPAQKSGLKEGDLIMEVDGKPVNDATELMQAVRTAKDKNNMKLKLSRNGKSQDLDLKVPKKLKTASL